MNISPTVDEDPLDGGLRAAFGPVDELASGDSVYEVLRACGAIQKCVSLRQESIDVVERISPELTIADIPKRYHVSGEIARGGVGVVLKGHDIDLGREVALKMLRAEHAGNPSLTRRLVEEAQIGGQLQHPGILPVYELGLDSAKRPFFAMKLVRGRTLAELLKERKSPSDDQPRFLGIFEQLCHAMAYAHARGVIHRDLKPANVMVGRFGEVQVVDWGLAKVLPRNDSNDDTWDIAQNDSSDSRVQSAPQVALSEAGSVLGTPAYMPPEQASGDIERLDERSDVFGLGAILCEILTGSPPYEGARLAILEQARAGRIEPAVQRLRQSGAANELIDLAVACLKPNRTDRPRDASEVVKIVQAHRDTVDLRARAAEIEAAKAKATMAAERRVRSLVVTIAGILILATAAGGALYSLYQYQKRQAAEAQLIADRARLDLERERRERLEASLEILVPLDGKARYMVLEAANVANRDLDRWLHLMGMLREVVNRTAENAPTDDARRKAKELAAQLLECEESLKDRIAKRK
jgi:tRNA A-37 threonylcarbamoyl transferase component Bud32